MTMKNFINKIKEQIKSNPFKSGIVVGGFATLIIIFLLGLIV